MFSKLLRFLGYHVESLKFFHSSPKENKKVKWPKLRI